MAKYTNLTRYILGHVFCFCIPFVFHGEGGKNKNKQNKNPRIWNNHQNTKYVFASKGTWTKSFNPNYN